MIWAVAVMAVVGVDGSDGGGDLDGSNGGSNRT